MPQQLAIIYRANGGRLLVDLELRVQASGQAEAFVGTSYSIPLERVNRVGRFAGQAPAEQIEALRTYVAQHNLLTRGGSHGQFSPDAPSRTLSLTADGQQVDLTLEGMSADPVFDGFEKLLQQLALTLTAQPVQAVEATLDVVGSSDQLNTAIELRSIGTQPFTALFVDPNQAAMVMRAQVEVAGQMALPSGASMPMPVGTATLSPDAVQALVQAGTLPSGIATLALDRTYIFAMPSLPPPRVTMPVSATGTLSFWLPDGQARRQLVILTPDVRVP
jgi:hypothetical protein